MASKPLLDWVNSKGMKELQNTRAFKRLTSDSSEVVAFTDGEFTIQCSPNASYGYLYIGAWQYWPKNCRYEQKETDRVTKLVEKAQKTPPDQPLEGQIVSVSRLLEIMDVSNPRRESFRGRPTIVFDFQGRKDAKTHGLAEDASKKLRGAVWIDEADLQVAHLEVSFDDNFKIAGGLFASIQKGSSFRFDQAPVADGLWLPTGAESTIQARLLMVKNLREHYIERDSNFQRFRVETQQSKDAKPVPERAQ